MLNSLCVVGPDSGPAHLAGVLKVPSIVLGYGHLPNIYGCYPEAEFITAPEGVVDAISMERVLLRIQARCRTLEQLSQGRSLISEDRLAVLRDEVLATNHLAGDAAELGVYRGGSAKVIAHYLQASARLHLFDTWMGIPETDSHPDGQHVQGDFAATYSDVRAFLGEEGMVYHLGVFPGTALENTWYRFVHFDGDTYQSTIAALEYFVPRMVAGGVMVFDDYGWWTCPGVARALHEQFPDERIEQKTKYQAIVRWPL
jgi:hypothetical protein